LIAQGIYLYANLLVVVVAPLTSKVASFPDYVLKVLHHYAWYATNILLFSNKLVVISL